MRVERERGPAGTSRAGLLILALGIAIGALLDPIAWLRLDRPRPAGRPLTAPEELEAFLRPPLEPVPSGTNELETLSVELDEEAARRLQSVRDLAMQRGMIVQDEEDVVPAVVRLGAKRIEAEVRIKGDWTDHVDTNKWSLRVKLKKDKLLGMSVFSVQHPKTRGMLWEWFIQAAARREGILAPRSTFVNVTLNGNDMGVYFLEEHFSKELLESQGRREGPIVLWDESTRWASLLQAHNVGTKDVELPVPRSAALVWGADRAPVRAFREKRSSSIESLSRSLYSGVEQMEKLQAMVIASAGLEPQLNRLRARERIHGETVDALVDTVELARMHALCSLFQVHHALVWHNLRFYHDPVLDRLAPILFDTDSQSPSGRDPVLFDSTEIMREFGTSDAYYNGVFTELGRMCEPEYLEELFADLQDELRRYETALRAEFSIAGKFSSEGMLERLRTQQVYLRRVIRPVDPINFHATYDLVEEQDVVSAKVEVQCWATTRTPVVVEGFGFSNGVRLSGRGALKDDPARVTTTAQGGVVLPNDGSPVRFRFPADDRLANLEKVDRTLAALLDPAAADATLDLDIDLLQRPLADEAVTRERITFRRVDPAWRKEVGRPQPPTLEEALARHVFLEYRPEQGDLRLREGIWDVEGDLVLPSGIPLQGQGSTLRFESDAVLLADAPLDLRSVTLEPREGLDRWRGVVVLSAGGRSQWRNVTVRATDAVTRGGWLVTGGITFYRSPITMIDCRIDGTWAEDGANIFGADFLLERVVFSACVSDAFDGDFVSGTVRDCTFRDGKADGVDVSGSDVLVENCRFLSMGDKGVSAGEDSFVRVRGGLCDGVSIGIAAKDRSRVDAEGMTIKGARNYALASFVKKPEFGPGSLVARNVVIEGSGLGDVLAQTGCTLELNGVVVATQDLDVDKLYEDKILGQ